MARFYPGESYLQYLARENKERREMAEEEKHCQMAQLNIKLFEHSIHDWE